MMMTPACCLQVAQGVLGHMDSLIDRSQELQRRDLEDLLLTYGISCQPNAIAGKHY